MNKKRYKVCFVDTIDYLYTLGTVIPLIFLAIFLIFNCFDKNFDIYSIMLDIIILAIVIIGIYALFLIRNVSKDDLKTFILDENNITIITNSNKYIISNNEIAKCLVNIDFSSDWVGLKYYATYYLTIKINNKLHYAFHTMTFGSIKKFLKIANHIPNCTCTTSSNFIPFDTMQGILQTRRGLNILQILYYCIPNAINTAPPLAIILVALALGILCWFIIDIVGITH